MYLDSLHRGDRDICQYNERCHSVFFHRHDVSWNSLWSNVIYIIHGLFIILSFSLKEAYCYSRKASWVSKSVVKSLQVCILSQWKDKEIYSAIINQEEIIKRVPHLFSLALFLLRLLCLLRSWMVSLLCRIIFWVLSYLSRQGKSHYRGVMRAIGDTLYSRKDFYVNIYLSSFRSHSRWIQLLCLQCQFW